MGIGLARLAVITLVLGSCAVPVRAGITVTSYRTTAGTNAFAPVGGSQYIDQQILTNVSPAHASGSGDWVGPNAGGSANTWHWIGAAQLSMSTTFDSSMLSITGAGNFAHELTTTSEFVDPRSASVFSPGSGADYQCAVSVDTSAAYTITVLLGQWGKVSLSSSQTGFIFNETNFAASPRLVQFSGTIPPGNFAVRANAGLAIENLSPGLHHVEYSGGFDNLDFVLQVPEPGVTGFLLTMSVLGIVRRQRRPIRTCK